ncbi:MAG: EFR1 family ferrodoxin [Selenomonadaceae bacterium]|nr:EFR1 family ferrodoxin [Selenomonadaceae bacterium]
MKNIIYCYTATGNSLYAARFLRERLPDTEIRYIPEELMNGRFEISAERIGFIFPLHYLSLPMQVEEFLARLNFTGTPYLFAVVTCGVPYWGRPFIDMNEILSRKGQRLQGEWFLRLVSNYLPYRDTAAQWRIKIRAWFAERKLKDIAESVAQNESHSTWQLLKDMCRRYHNEWRERRKTIDEKFSCDINKCTSCGLCERVCPKKNILRPEGHPVWQHDCVECLACLHICPTQAIDYGGVTRGRRRYRHSDIKIADLIRAWRKSK